MTQTFDVFAVGDTIFHPSIKTTEIPLPCPDCNDGGTWTVTIPCGITRTIPCPRCKGDKHRSWIWPRRHERALEIKELKIRAVHITCGQHGDEPPTTSVYYETIPFIGSIYPNKAFRTREEAEAAGALLMAEDEKRENDQWRKEQKRQDERAGMNIVEALQAMANERADDLEEKIDRLKEQMMEAVKYPTIDGPRITKDFLGRNELTPQNLAEWLNKLLSEAGIDGWSEEELHEALCHC